jgi:hypothetical protein
MATGTFPSCQLGNSPIDSERRSSGTLCRRICQKSDLWRGHLGVRGSGAPAQAAQAASQGSDRSAGLCDPPNRTNSHTQACTPNNRTGKLTHSSR